MHSHLVRNEESFVFHFPESIIGKFIRSVFSLIKTITSVPKRCVWLYALGCNTLKGPQVQNTDYVNSMPMSCDGGMAVVVR